MPRTATFEIQDKTFVYTIVDGKTHATPIEVTRANGGTEFIVNSGLQVGDIIVAEGVGLLREDTPIKAKDSSNQ